LLSQPPTPPGSSGQPLPQPQPQAWPQQGIQPPPDRGVDPDGPATDAASTQTDGDSPGWTPPPWSPDAAAGDSPGWTPPPWSPDAAAGDSPGWTPPPWSPDAAHTPPSWKLILAGCLIAAIVLLGPLGWLFDASRSSSGKPEVAPAEPTQVRTEVATPDEIDESEDLNWDEYNIDDSVDLRVGDCFDLKDPSAEIEHVKAVPCKTEHDYELFYVGAMAKGSHPTAHAFATYLMQNCNPAFGAYIGKAYKDSDLDYIWLVPTEDAWRSGDRTVQCAVNDPNNFLLKGSLRGAHR
jgi:putative regulator of septum formation